MQTENIQAIVLRRTNYGEADKIITSLTSKGDKINIIAKGVRKSKSKLVAGTELFCVSDICYVMGKGSMATLTSARIVSQHTQFLDNLDKVNLAYDIIKTVHKHTEDSASTRYFTLLQQVFMALDTPNYDVDTIRIWAWLQLLQESGHQLQLEKQTNGDTFDSAALYAFDAENGGFMVSAGGNFRPDHIKLLRIAQSQPLTVLQRISNAPRYSFELTPVIKQFVETTY